MHIDAFEKNAIYALTADSFKDPYDTLLQYDQKGIRQYVDRVMSIEGLEQLKAFFAQGNNVDINDNICCLLVSTLSLNVIKLSVDSSPAFRLSQASPGSIIFKSFAKSFP